MVRKISFILILLNLVAFSASAQSIHPKQEKQPGEIETYLRYLDISPSDTVAYATGLVKTSDYCLRQGMIEEAFVLASIADAYLGNNNRRTNLINSHKGDAVIIMGMITEYFHLNPSLGDPAVFYKEAADLYREVGKSCTLKQIKALKQLAIYYRKTQDFIGAENALLITMELIAKYPINSMEEFHSLVNCVCGTFIDRRDVKQAEEAIRHLDDISLSNRTKAVWHCQWANIFILKKDYAKASAHLNQSLANFRLCRPSLIELRNELFPPDFIQELSYTARLLAKAGYKKQALDIYRKIEEELFFTLEHNLTCLIYDIERRHVWNVLQPFFEEIQQFTYTNNSLEGAKELLYENLQLQKDLFLNSIFQYPSVAQLVRNDKWVVNALLKIESLSNEEGMTNTIVGSNMIERVKLGMKIFQLSRDVISYFNQNSNDISIKRRNWDRTKSTLQPGAAVIEFFEVLHNEKKEKEYGALVFTKNSTTPQLVTLCSEGMLKRVVNQEDKWNRNLYDMIWKPIVPHLEQVSDIFISTAGLLNTISFAGLRDGNVYMCEKYNLHNVMSTSNIPAKQTTATLPRKNIYLWGGIDFGLPQPASSKMRGQGFSYLPGSLREIEEIEKSLSKEWNVYKFIGKDATEKNLRKIAKQTNISVLHISTHGFYLPYDSSIREKVINKNGKSGFFDPTIRTGLAFSGANSAWRGETPIDFVNDCLLTAIEIATLWHLDAELVVLSACNTGLGEIKDGEGVYSLQRAFRAIGVNSMIVSLGEVPDNETQELMKKFYEYWQSGLDKDKAFIRAQRFMKSKYPNEPEKWAGFIFMR